jgi:LCP family protein required for cell wall assembly
MSEELKVAFEQMAHRGRPAGAQTVVASALADAQVGRRSGPRRRAFAVVTALVATVAVVIGGVAVVQSRVPDIERVQVGAALADGDGISGTMTVLAVGSDSRTGLNDPLRRADAIMLLRVNRTTGAVSVLSMPRDLYVPIAGTASSDRLSAASVSSPTALIETVRAVTGIAIDHYLEFDFAGFKNVVDAAGGVDLRLPARMRDELAGLDLPAGCNHLDGAAALAYVQSRHASFQETPGGRFTPDPTGDLGRIGRQQLLLLVALDQLTRTRDPVRIDRVANAIANSVRVDEGFSLHDAIEFARNWIHTDGPLSLLTYPSTATVLRNGAAVLDPDTAQATNVINTFNNPPNERPDQQSPGASCG